MKLPGGMKLLGPQLARMEVLETDARELLWQHAPVDVEASAVPLASTPSRATLE